MGIGWFHAWIRLQSNPLCPPMYPLSKQAVPMLYLVYGLNGYLYYLESLFIYIRHIQSAQAIHTTHMFSRAVKGRDLCARVPVSGVNLCIPMDKRRVER